MSTIATKEAPTYLRDARLGAGFVNRHTASTRVPYSPETIGRHERGENPMAPEDALVYAECYGRGDILIRYCACCPVGVKLHKAVEERDFAVNAIRLKNRLKNAPQLMGRLMEIADDGRVNDWERDDFVAILSECVDIINTIKELKLWAYQAGVATPEELKAAKIADIKEAVYSTAREIAQ